MFLKHNTKSQVLFFTQAKFGKAFPEGISTGGVCFTLDNRLYGMKSYQTYEFKKE